MPIDSLIEKQIVNPWECKTGVLGMGDTNIVGHTENRELKQTLTTESWDFSNLYTSLGSQCEDLLVLYPQKRRLEEITL